MGKWFYILVVMAVLFSCSKENGSGPDVPGDFPSQGSGIPVGFSATGEWNLLSKAGLSDDGQNSDVVVADPSINGFTDGDSLMVYGYYRKPGEETGSVPPNFMYDQPVVFDGTNWHYSPVKYWPNNAGEKLDFYAYSPLNRNISVSENTQVGPPVIKYRLRPAGDARTDILYAESVDMAKPSDDTKTELKFKHLMGKLQFFFSVLPPDGALDANGMQIEVNDGQYRAHIQSMSYTVNTKGDFNFSYENGLPKWELISEGEDATRTLVRETVGTGRVVDKGTMKADDNKKYGEYIHDFTAFLLPVTIEKLDVGLSMNGGITHSIKEVVLPKNEEINIVAGKVTTVHLKIQQGKVITLKLTVETKDWFEKPITPTFPIY